MGMKFFNVGIVVFYVRIYCYIDYYDELFIFIFYCNNCYDILYILIGSLFVVLEYVF